MHRVCVVFLLAIVFVITVDCQDAKSPLGCIGDNCEHFSNTWKIILAIIGFLVVAWLIAFLLWIFVLKGKPLRSNPQYVNKGIDRDDEAALLDMKLFTSGLWTSRYYKFNEWHGPHSFSLIFDSHSYKVSGVGRDDIGMYAVDGIYSIKTRRIGITKKYQIGTGDPLENIGQTITIQVEWKPKESQFEGTWYVDENKFKGEDKFELKFYKTQELPRDTNFEQHGAPF